MRRTIMSVYIVRMFSGTGYRVGRTVSPPPIRCILTIAQNEDDEDKSGGDEERTEPVDSTFRCVNCGEMSGCQRGVGGDREETANETETSQSAVEVEGRTPARATVEFISKDGRSGRKGGATNLVSCVSTPPIINPKAAPTGAPAEKEANAMERRREGEKAWARMPSCIGEREK
jgi:hypothetical protein